MVDFCHHVPGRLRVRSARLERDAPAAADLRAALLAIGGVRSVSHNAATGSVTILYDRDTVDADTLWHTIERLGFDRREPANPPPHSAPRLDARADALADMVARVVADHLAKAAMEAALRRLLGRPAAALVGALI